METAVAVVKAPELCAAIGDGKPSPSLNRELYDLQLAMLGGGCADTILF